MVLHVARAYWAQDLHLKHKKQIENQEVETQTCH